MSTASKLTQWFETLDGLLYDGAPKNSVTPNKHNELLRELVDALEEQYANWEKKVISFADIQLNSLTNEVTLLVADGDSEQNAARVVVSTPFAGVTTLLLNVGDAGDNTRYVWEHDCKTAGNDRYTNVGVTNGQVKAYFIGSEDLDNLTAGEITVYLRTEKYNLD
jgi:hypothetical protein